MKLTPKQEKFAQLYVELGNASEAYRQSYNASKMKNETIAVAASNLLTNHNVTIRVQEIREELSKAAQIGLKELLAELEEARQAALTCDTPQSSAAVAASMGKAKLLGLDKQIIDHKSSDGSMTPKSFTLEDYAKAQTEVIRKLKELD